MPPPTMTTLRRESVMTNDHTVAVLPTQKAIMMVHCLLSQPELTIVVGKSQTEDHFRIHLGIQTTNSLKANTNR